MHTVFFDRKFYIYIHIYKIYVKLEEKFLEGKFLQDSPPREFHVKIQVKILSKRSKYRVRNIEKKFKGF